MKGKEAWNKGKHPSDETRKRQAEAQRGRKLPEDVRKKISDSKIGKHRSKEVKQKLSLARKGAHLSDETRIKISIAMSGENNPRWNKHCSEDTRKKLSEANLGKRASNETKQKMSKANRLENNPRWRGGSSYLPYCSKFTESFKECVRDRFNRTCFLCGSSEDSRKHCVHHIDYNKNSLCNGQSWAFVPLCNGCHSKTNNNRWHWFNLLINYWALNPEINF